MREALERGDARWEDIPDLGPALDAAIAALPEELRLLVLLVDVEGYTYEEAAKKWASRPGRCDPASVARDAFSRNA